MKKIIISLFMLSSIITASHADHEEVCQFFNGVEECFYPDHPGEEDEMMEEEYIPFQSESFDFIINGQLIKAKTNENTGWNADPNEPVELLFYSNGLSNTIDVPGLLINDENIRYDEVTHTVILYEGKGNEVVINTNEEGKLNNNESFYGGHDGSKYMIYVVEDKEGVGEDGIDGDSYKIYELSPEEHKETQEKIDNNELSESDIDEELRKYYKFIEEVLEVQGPLQPANVKKKSKADKLVDGITDTWKQINSLDDICHAGNIYLETPEYNGFSLQYKNERCEEYFGVKFTLKF